MNDQWLQESSSRMDGLMRDIHENQHKKDNPVIEVCAALKNYIEEFESGLDQNHELGIRLVSFGQAISFHAQQIGFTKPNIITFWGITSEGEKIQLIQHVSQLSFLLKAAKKLEEKPIRIGFIWS